MIMAADPCWKKPFTPCLGYPTLEYYNAVTVCN